MKHDTGTAKRNYTTSQYDARTGGGEKVPEMGPSPLNILIILPYHHVLCVKTKQIYKRVGTM